MKLIVNNYTPLIVVDENDNVLFQWLPSTVQHTVRVSTDVNEDAVGELKKAIRNMKNTEFTIL